MISKYILFFILGMDALVLFFQTSQISISYSEASLLYGNFSVLQFLTNLSLGIFGNNDFGLRFVMISFHLASAYLMYEISKQYISQERNRIWLVLVFVLLPGVISAAIVLHSAGMIIFGLLLFIYLSQRVSQNVLNIFLLLLTFIDTGFAYLFLSLSVYYLTQKRYRLFLFTITLYLINSFIFGFNIDGFPRGHFLDTIGIYSAIFTPIIFIYLFYSLYRRYLTSQTDMVWFIASVTLVLSLVLSFRQRVDIEYFAPYLIVSIPLAAQSFISSYRVRLKMFRTSYRLAFILSFIFLISNSILVLINKNIYIFIENPKKHFAYKMHVAKELASKLKSDKIFCVTTNKRMQLRLRFYNIKKCDDNQLIENFKGKLADTSVTVSYKNRIVYKANVTKINNI